MKCLKLGITHLYSGIPVPFSGYRRVWPLVHRSIFKTAGPAGCSQNSVLSIIQTVVQGKDNWLTGERVMRTLIPCKWGAKTSSSSLILQKSCCSTKWLKKLMLAMIKRCLKTQCIAACSIVAQASQSAHADPTTKSTYNGHVSIITKLWSSEIRQSVQMDHVFLYIMWKAGSVVVERWDQGAIWDKCKQAKAHCSGQCSAWKPLCPGSHLDVTLTHTN